MPVALALAASVAWGVTDFLGGLKSRTVALLLVLLVSQSAGFVLIAGFVAVTTAPAAPVETFVYGGLAGLALVLGLASLYRGMVIGMMSVVAPISATGAVLPLVVGLVRGERPTELQVLGLGLAVVGVVLTAREVSSPPEGRPRGRLAAGVGLALVAAVGIGCFLLAMDAASTGDIYWATFAQKGSAAGFLVVLALATRPRLTVKSGDMKALLAMGVFDVSGTALFAAATTRGLVSIVAVLASLYPVTTVLMARFLLDEQLDRVRQAGVATALGGIALVSAGG